MLTVVVGGGISGLSCAFNLQRQGQQALLLEGSSRVGGVIQSVEQDGFLFEWGPQSFLSGDALLELVAALGIEDQLERGDSRAPRYVLLGGKLRRAPLAPPSLLNTSLLSASTKFRLLSEPFRRTQPHASDESIAQFVRRKFGAELLDHLVAPFVSGVYAGDPEKLSVRAAFPSLQEWERAYGSVIRGALKSRPPKGKPRPTLCSFRGGLETLTRALQQHLRDSLRTGTTVENIRRSKVNGSTYFDLQCQANGKTESLHADAVVIAAPSVSAARFLGGLSSRFADLLGRIEYAPVAVVTAGYRRQDVTHPLQGFGFLVPRKEGLNILGTVWTSSLFPGRAPEGMVSLASFVGGATGADAMEKKDQELMEVVTTENARVLGISAPPVVQMIHRHRRAIPQFNLGHPEIRSGLQEEAARFPGLFFSANYVEGPSIPVCVDQAVRVAASVRQYLAESPS